MLENILLEKKRNGKSVDIAYWIELRRTSRQICG